MAARGSGRIAECHPDRPHHGSGKCKRCYDREWLRQRRVNPQKPVQKKARYTLWPQEIVRVPVRGWGCLT
jgi:hypothetical protein